MSLLRNLLLALFAALLAAPAFAYTLYLKDGNTITIKGEFETRGDRAYFTYPNGTQGFLPVDQIDIDKTRNLNQDDIGGARVVQETEVIEEAPAPEVRQRGLGDLIQERQRRPQAGRPESQDAARGGSAQPTEPTRTQAGFLDLSDLPRITYPDLEVGAEVLKAFKSQGVEELRIYQGTTETRPYVSVTANSEASVLRAVAVAASALSQVRGQWPDKLEALELLITTPTGSRAGQFVITPELASQLLGGDTDITVFFVENVQF